MLAVTATEDVRPWFRVDLLGTYSITDIQLWAAVNYTVWLAPLAVFVSNTTLSPSLASLPDTPPGTGVCFWLQTSAAGMSLESPCAEPMVGRYVTVKYGGNAQPEAVPPAPLRLCGVLVFGQAVDTRAAVLPPSSPQQRLQVLAIALPLALAGAAALAGASFLLARAHFRARLAAELAKQPHKATIVMRPGMFEAKTLPTRTLEGMEGITTPLRGAALLQEAHRATQGVDTW